MDAHICQSCGMKMQPTEYGANADGSVNKEYCRYCLPDGKFSRNITMEGQLLIPLDIFCIKDLEIENLKRILTGI